ncbi:MAG TPA: hypothetical protein VFY12_03405 [Arenimonas sp.]|nr:hypothetical protein [Arenimonas sp.]
MTAPERNASLGRWLAVAASIVVLVTVATSILVTGTPSERRAAKLDERRVQDLIRLARAIDHHAINHDGPPASLAAVVEKPGSRLAVSDPETATAYEYTPTNEKAYRLCAVFVTDTARIPSRFDSEWDHGIGRQCFDRRVPKPD